MAALIAYLREMLALVRLQQCELCVRYNARLLLRTRNDLRNAGAARDAAELEFIRASQYTKELSNMALYALKHKTTGTVRLVSAITKSAAMRHVAETEWECDTPTPIEAAAISKTGVDVEEAPKLKIVGEAK